MKRNLFGIMLLSGISILPKANAQTTYEEMEQLTVNEQITTVITASEPVRFVDKCFWSCTLYERGCYKPRI